MARFNLRLADKEMEILEQVSKETDRTKTDILRELIRGIPNRPTSNSRKLTRTEVAHVIECINKEEWFCGEADGLVDELVDILASKYNYLVEN